MSNNRRVRAITVYLSNPAHTVNASSTGVVSSFGNAGTTIEVFEGATQLDYDGIGTGAGKFTVSASGTSISPDTISESGLIAVLGNSPTNMTADNAKIDLSVSGKRQNGEAFSETAQQLFQIAMEQMEQQDRCTNCKSSC